MARASTANPLCEATGKVRYRSEHHARRVRVHVHARIRIYFCTSCNGYHFTNPEKP